MKGNKLTIEFVDSRSRPEAVGDLEKYDLTYENCKTLFVAFSVNTTLPSQEKLADIFGRFGPIKAISMKQTPIPSQYRPHAFIDYETHVKNFSIL